MNYIKQLKNEKKINASSSIKVTSHPPHRGNFFSGWYGVIVDNYNMRVYGSAPAQLGAWEAEDSVKEEIQEYLEGKREFPPQSEKHN